MSARSTVHAHAKLNLFLNVTGRRADGYHELDSLFAFVGLSDELVFEPANKGWVSAWGEFASGVGLEKDNLVTRARDLLFAAAGVAPELAITIDKRIPTAAGLGGGSADAAATLLALNRRLGLDWPIELLLPLAAKLGADVPACLSGNPVIARGIGGQLSPAPAMPSCGILLVNPRVPTPTPAVFKTFRDLNPDITGRAFAPLPDRFENLGSLVDAIRPRSNDLLKAAILVTPVIAEVIELMEALPDVRYVGLSGSGATCFALFETEAEAAGGAMEFAPRRPTHSSRIWWTWCGCFV